ncbi:MAG: adenylate/guanylate cyclase domain-containing protein [Flavobacteriaceae bacterium]|nr:adenylate/guanylate cyclase domain-containing protein [Flavobacteriaceae bacterium]
MSQQRRLAAIMFTDIEGYTSLMQADEKKALGMREKHRNVFKRITAKYNGTIIQYFGDGTLSTFRSSVEAVECAIELQQAFSENPKIPVRIGIHVGDIIYQNDDIIGDAVNVASRIESCAVPGSILVSDKVHDQLRSHKHIRSEFLDAYEFKNVDGAMPVFAISNEGLKIPQPEEVKGKLKAASSPQKNASRSKKIMIAFGVLLVLAVVTYFLEFYTGQEPSNDKSIAVLPFDSFSKDPDSEILSEGVTEDILTQLSKLKDLHVISRTSVMQYKETKKNIREIAKELGVTFILEGSIQKHGDQIRVTAQLIDTENDRHLWADKYDMTLTNIFTIQSEVSEEIVQALNLNLSFEEQKELTAIPTKNIEAYKLFLTGRKEADLRTKESIAKSIELYKEAISLDARYAEAYAEIANSIFLETYYSRRNLSEATELANEYLEKAKKINPKVARIYTVEGLLNNHTRNFEKAKSAFEKAIKLSPNDVTARHQFATYYYYIDEKEKQLEQAEIAYRLDPLSFATGISYFTALTQNKKFDIAEKIITGLDSGSEKDQFLINRSYMRLYMAKKDFKKVIVPLLEIVKTEPSYYRFLGYSYAQLGDTLNAYNCIDSIKKYSSKRLKNHRLAVVYAGLQQTDSVFYHLDSTRNSTKLFNSKRLYYFDYLKDSSGYKKLLAQHGIDNME